MSAVLLQVELLLIVIYSFWALGSVPNAYNSPKYNLFH